MLIFTHSFLLDCLILSSGNKLLKFHSYLARLDGCIYCKGSNIVRACSLELSMNSDGFFKVSGEIIFSLHSPRLY